MAATACPVCLERFQEPVAFALHVANCTASLPTTGAAASSSSSSVSSLASCPMCHMVYTSAMAAHEIAFHEEECEAVNEWVDPAELLRVATATSTGSSNGRGGGGSGGSGGGASGAKRPRDSLDGSSSVAGASSSSSMATSANTGPPVTLFPSHCAVCDGGGRTLLHCAGKCARSFHPLCIEEINAKDVSATRTTTSAAAAASSSSSSSLLSAGGATSFVSAITRDKKAQKQWVCGECTRGLHTCQLCGFLGHEANELVLCSLPECGFAFHSACLRKQAGQSMPKGPLVCPRHTCTSCHNLETDMTKCISCTKCCTAQHIRCRDAVTTTATATAGTESSSSSIRTRGDASDPNFYVCDAHKEPQQLQQSAPATRALSERKAAQFAALKMNLRPGDVVLILEYGNSLLPPSVKCNQQLQPPGTETASAINHWGVVQRVENLNHGAAASWWTQLLTVTLFVDNSTIDLFNRYVLPMSAMRLYTTPSEMIRDAIKWHAMSEVNVRFVEEQERQASASSALSAAAAAAVAAIVSKRGVIVQAAISAFQGRSDHVGLPVAARLREAETGFTAWQAFTGGGGTYVDSGAPVYVALDTRGRSKWIGGVEEASGAERTERVAPLGKPGGGGGGEQEDVEMEQVEEEAEWQPAGGGGGATRGAAGGGSSRQSQTAVDACVAETMMDILVALEMERAESLKPKSSLSLPAAAAAASPSVVTVTSSSASLKDMVSQMKDDSDSSSNVQDEEMEIDIEEEEDAEPSSSRLSVDELLNPMSQDATLPSTMMDIMEPQEEPEEEPEEPEEENPVENDDDEPTNFSKKRPLDKAVDIVDLLDGGDHEDTSKRRRLSKKPTLYQPHSYQQSLQQKHQKATEISFTYLPSVPLKPPRSSSSSSSSSSVFTRGLLPLSSLVAPPLKRKEKLFAELPNVMIQELELQVDAFFGSEENEQLLYPSTSGTTKRSGSSAAAKPIISRPAFYRPSPFLYQGSSSTTSRMTSGGRRAVDAISRVLLCQDKRSFKCFFLWDHATATTSQPRKHCKYVKTTQKMGCVTVDLMDIGSFAALESVVRGRIASVLQMAPKRGSGAAASGGGGRGGERGAAAWHWQSSDDATEVVEEEEPVPSSSSSSFFQAATTHKMPEMKLSYCLVDGSEHLLLAGGFNAGIKSSGRAHGYAHQQQQLQSSEWLCFCANVLHLTATLSH